MDNCPVCKHSIPHSDFIDHPEGTPINCSYCGRYRVSESFLIKSQLGLSDIHIYSGALREHYENGNYYSLKDLTELRYSVSVPKSPLEQIDKLLLHINRTSNSPAQVIEFGGKDYPIAYAKNADELFFLIQKAWEMGLLDHTVTGLGQARLSVPAGWQRISELHENKIKFDQVFVAMWFDPEVDDVWQSGFIPALEHTGFVPRRIDKKEHNNKIDDEIIAEIRKSGFLIADFTGNRGGVYFEAGFAMGLGIPVIWTCREDQIKEVHFDTRQYSHITWKTPEELKQKLINRIEATIPKSRK